MCDVIQVNSIILPLMYVLQSTLEYSANIISTIPFRGQLPLSLAMLFSLVFGESKESNEIGVVIYLAFTSKDRGLRA